MSYAIYNNEFGSKTGVALFVNKCQKELLKVKFSTTSGYITWVEIVGTSLAIEIGYKGLRFTTGCIDKKFDSDIKLVIKGGKLGGTIGYLAGVVFSKKRYGYDFKVYIKIIREDGTAKIIKRILSSVELERFGNPITYKVNDLKQNNEEMATRTRENKFGHTISIGSIVLVFNKNLMKLEHAKVEKIHKTYITYVSVTSLHKKKNKNPWRCYDHWNLMYLVPNPDEIETEMALDILTNS